MADATFLQTLVSEAYNPAFNAEHRMVSLIVAFFSLATGSLLIPVPEELLVGVVGFSASAGADNTAEAVLYLVLALLPCSLAVVCGDALIWFLGLRMGLAARSRFKFVARAASDARVATVQQTLKRYGPPAILLARLVPGTRICTFFVAGATRMPLSRFLLFDFLGSLASVSICLSLGALAAHKDYGAAWAREAAGNVSCIAALIASTAGLAMWSAIALIKRMQKRPSDDDVGSVSPAPVATAASRG